MSNRPSGSGSRSGGPQAELKVATPEQMASIKRLVQIVARAFYEDKHIVVVDQLVEQDVMPADMLAQRLGTQLKEVTALCSKLQEDGLVSSHRRNESKENVHARTFQRTYFYLDYKRFLDVTKWRMMKMRSSIDKVLRNELDNKGYVCPRCLKSFGTLEVAHLLDFSRNVLVCDTPGCMAELVDNEDAEDVKRSKDKMMRFNMQLSPILEGLRKVEGVALMSLDVGEWLQTHAAEIAWSDPSNATDDPLSLPASGGVSGTPSLQIDISGSDPASDAARRRAAEEERERRRAQNALPEWHLASTVSGEKTALGIKEGKRAVGVVFGNQTEEVENEEEADYYSQYASMQASAPDSTTGIPEEEETLEFEEVEPEPQPSSQPFNSKRAREEYGNGDGNGNGYGNGNGNGTNRHGSEIKRAREDPGLGPADQGAQEEEEDMGDFEEVV